MNDSEIEALATTIARQVLTSPTGVRADHLTQYKEGTGILGTMNEAAIQQRTAKAIRHHLETTTTR